MLTRRLYNRLFIVGRKDRPTRLAFAACMWLRLPRPLKHIVSWA